MLISQQRRTRQSASVQFTFWCFFFMSSSFSLFPVFCFNTLQRRECIVLAMCVQICQVVGPPFTHPHSHKPSENSLYGLWPGTGRVTGHLKIWVVIVDACETEFLDGL